MYTVYNLTESRIITLPEIDGLRYRFKAVYNDTVTPVKLVYTDNGYIGYFTGALQVYRVPSASTIHREYMKQNSRTLWLGVTPDFDRLASNMLDYIETV